MNGLRVAMCTDTYLPQTNGVVVAVRCLCEELARRGHDVAVFAPGPASGSMRHGGIEVHYILGRPFRAYREYTKTWRMGTAARAVRRFGPDVIHAHTPAFLGAAAWRASRRIEVPLVTSFHTPIDRYVEYLPYARGPVLPALSWVARRYQRWFYSRSDVCTFPTRRAMDFIWLPPHTAVRVLPNGVDLKRFRPGADASAARRHYRLGDGPLVLYAGRLGAEKRVDVLLRGFATASLALPECRLLVCGEGPARARLERLTDALGISERVRFAGYVPDRLLPSVYAAADALALPSPVETQSLVLLEAMACGLPVVGADAGAIPEALRSGENGLLFPPGDHSALARRLVALLSDRGLRRRLGRGAMETARRFSWEGCALRLERLYREVLGAPSG